MKEVPVRWGYGGPVVGTAEVADDGTCTVKITDPAAIVVLAADSTRGLSLHHETVHATFPKKPL